ncbi:unnamed protein product [Didymodactylos carnosus]|uniref:FAM124 domain-containing protein n=1 Tax=Didymodactylos carnosus TaxID=1234261 RepID=A0A814U0Q7_9BILA|nr:unnamed protein product [Didymodactylos carnosus]CAF1168361.1 unnamed protein product [Didymodactylos carnosus]CAF3932010.1 unnamed protein product [Didymodactylos carnosus]CAF3976242.1 unnamed protein product [Didymodactylos carnosus]
MSKCQCPCELVLKVGCNEADEISSALTNLLRSCSISENNFFLIERQTQPTSYFGSFTTPTTTSSSSNSSIDDLQQIPSQSLSCVLLITDDILKRQQLVSSLSSVNTNVNGNNGKLPKSKYFFKSSIWNFHHKIELLDEFKSTIARQDYYELSKHLPLWSVSHVPLSRLPIIRFNIFTLQFDLMVKFYSSLFQHKPESTKPGFVLYILQHSQTKIVQFSIKYSPSIKSYCLSQTAHLKFCLKTLSTQLQTEYSSKLFYLNKYEYCIHDPDGNLLHLHLVRNEQTTVFVHEQSQRTAKHPQEICTNDSGVGESDPQLNLFSSIVPQGYHPYPRQQLSIPPTVTTKINGTVPQDQDIHSHSSQSSHDSGRWSSISSNELATLQTTTVPEAVQPIQYVLNGRQSTTTIKHVPITNRNVFENAGHEYRQQRVNIDKSRERVFGKSQNKSTLYESEPRLLTNLNLFDSNKSSTNRYYSSMSTIEQQPLSKQYNNHQQHIRLVEHDYIGQPAQTSTPLHISKSTCLRPWQEETLQPQWYDQTFDVSYEVDSPRSSNYCLNIDNRRDYVNVEDVEEPLGYLNAFLQKKNRERQATSTPTTPPLVLPKIQEKNKWNVNAVSQRRLLNNDTQRTNSINVKALIAQFETPNNECSPVRPLSAPLIESTTNRKPKSILHRRSVTTSLDVHKCDTNINTSRKRSKSVTFDCNENQTDDENEEEHDNEQRVNRPSSCINFVQQERQIPIEVTTHHRSSAIQRDGARSPKLDIGITLDSRLRKTPVLEMIRSSAMPEEKLCDPELIDLLKRTSSLRRANAYITANTYNIPIAPIARF